MNIRTSETADDGPLARLDFDRSAGWIGDRAYKRRTRRSFVEYPIDSDVALLDQNAVIRAWSGALSA